MSRCGATKNKAPCCCRGFHRKLQVLTVKLFASNECIICRIQQLENLRNNYTAQSQRIRDNYTLQLQSMRVHYANQTKGMREGSSDGHNNGYNNVKEQYCDNINKMRDYSNGQLARCHENYIFQRQRLRKFSAANYLKIRETGKYTQKTLNRVIEHMPTLYVDLTSCRQGAPDWDDEMEEGPPPMEMTDMNGVGESQSLYFTPSGTPLRDGPGSHAPFSDNPGGNPYSPVYSPSPNGKSQNRKSHKRMVSNLSNFLPFWWGMGQSDQHSTEDPGTTIAIVEHNQNQGEDSCIGDHNAVISLDNIQLVIKNGEAIEVTEPESPKAMNETDIVKNGEVLKVQDNIIKNGALDESIIPSINQEDISSMDDTDGATGQSA